MRAMGRETARVMVTGVNKAESGRKTLITLCLKEKLCKVPVSLR